MRGIFRTILAAGTAFSLIASAAAQDVDAMGTEVAKNLREVEMLEKALKDAEKHRLAGDCESMKWIYVLYMRRLERTDRTYLTAEGPPANLSPEVKADFKRRMQELALLECPPGSGITLRGTPVVRAGTGPTPEGHEAILDEIGDDIGSTAPDRDPAPAPQPPVTVVLPPIPDGGGADDCPDSAPFDGVTPVCPGGTSAAPQTPPEPEGFEPIFDEIGGDIGATKSGLPVKPEADPPRTAPPPPPPRKPEEVHIPPKPTASTGMIRPSRGDILDGMAPQRAALGVAIGDCDKAAFKAAKNQLLEELGKLLTRFPGNIHLLAERRRIEETQLPVPCPPESRTALAPVTLDPASATFLALHNRARAEVGSPPLQWDPALAASAKAYAIKLTSAGQLVHSSREGRKTVRENLLQNLPGGRTPNQMIGVWTAEKSNFKPGIFPDVSTTGNWYDIGHYTQMVWETTTHVGCALNGDARFEWLVCHYSPPGNRDGTAIGMPKMPQPRHVVASNPQMPQLRGVTGQEGIAPANSTTTTAPPPPPPPPTARDDAPEGDEARHPLNGYFAEALARHATAVDCGDKAAAAAELVKMRYALDELKKRLKAAKKAGPYSAVKPDDVQKQIDDMEAKIRSAELRPGPGACPPMPQPRAAVSR